MAQYLNTAEGGTDGTAVTTANSGGASGNAFALITKGGAATINYSTVGKSHGSLGVRAVSAGAATDKWNIRYVDLAAATDVMSFRAYFTLISLPSQAQNLFVVIDTTGASVFAAGLLAGNTLRAVANGGATLGSYTTALTAGTLYRIEMQWRKGTTTTDGQAAVQLFAGDSTTALWTYSATNVNVGTIQGKQFWLGDNTTTRITDVTIDSMALDDASQTALGPYTAAPTASVVPTSVISATGWTVVGAADIPTALADASDATYALSSDSPVNLPFTVGSNGNLNTGAITIPARLSKRDATTTGTVKITLLNSAGVAVAAEQTYTVTTTPASYPYSLTPTENNNLTNRSGLQWRVIATA